MLASASLSFSMRLPPGFGESNNEISSEATKNDFAGSLRVPATPDPLCEHGVLRTSLPGAELLRMRRSRERRRPLGFVTARPLAPTPPDSDPDGPPEPGGQDVCSTESSSTKWWTTDSSDSRAVASMPSAIACTLPRLRMGASGQIRGQHRLFRQGMAVSFAAPLAKPPYTRDSRRRLVRVESASPGYAEGGLR